MDINYVLLSALMFCLVPFSFEMRSCMCVLTGGYGGPEGWPAMPPGYAPPPGYDYYSGYYYPPYGAYPPGYDYSGYYDYSAYYSQPPADWSSYATAAAAASYAPPYTGVLYVLGFFFCKLLVGCLYKLCSSFAGSRVHIEQKLVKKNSGIFLVLVISRNNLLFGIQQKFQF